ncbi:hypothetical protein CEXT_238101 [Caerostris extrusa]|uniref:TLDc domain-containing protein n=1 Tax=Caerostris extrusa TaxID=172846 RepID=A0AAV4QNU1_CAEEX|nr:hypothetical protein CEXT_238101 [Caerostris extrusa]
MKSLHWARKRRTPPAAAGVEFLLSFFCDCQKTCFITFVTGEGAKTNGCFSVIHGISFRGSRKYEFNTDIKNVFDDECFLLIGNGDIYKGGN